MRHVTPSKLRRDEDCNVIGVLGLAFRLRDNEPSLSAAWLEYHRTASRSTDIAATIAAFKAAREVKKNDRFTVGNVGAIKRACADAGQSVRVVHEPVKGFDCHAAVRQIKTDDDGLLDVLAEEAWAEMHS